MLLEVWWSVCVMSLSIAQIYHELLPTLSDQCMPESGLNKIGYAVHHNASRWHRSHQYDGKWNTNRCTGVIYLGTGMKHRQIAEKMNVSQISITRILPRHHKTDYMTDRHHPGRPRTTIEKNGRSLFRSAIWNRTTSAPALADEWGPHLTGQFLPRWLHGDSKIRQFLPRWLHGDSKIRCWGVNDPGEQWFSSKDILMQA